ncbi:fibrinogen-like YCDxxxxGGGW domain-containing protein [Aeromicrobium sp. P5_D10]
MRAPTRRTLRAAVLAVLAPAVALSGLAALNSPASAAAQLDGQTPATAAASCWEIKQTTPSSPDGVYWILTPQLKVPTQIYCDQSTDGGGWALVGRGRNGWSMAYNGNATPAQVASPVTGQAAFAPKQLDSAVVNALLGGKRFDDPMFGDGVRIRRATNTAGTEWQETRWTYRANSRDRWNWSFGAGFPLASVNIGGSTGSNLTTYEFGADSAYKRLWTYESSRNNYVRGFNFGQYGYGTTDPDSYIYSSANNGFYGTPFSQVFIRPKIMSDDLDFASIPDAGTAAETIRAVPKNGSLASTWGVSGIGNGGSSENASEVQAFAQIGNTMYVGGNFTTVQKGAAATGTDKVAQAYLAAFDATTGEFIRSFTPQLNSHVKALKALPGGRLAVGGEFTQADGTARSGLVVVNATTGRLDPTWTTNLQNNSTGGAVSVRGLDTDGTYLYLTGAFTHFVKPGTTTRYAKGGARVLISTGVADNNWNPEFNGTGTALDVSEDKTRVYFAGYFTTARGGTVADRAAAFTTQAGAPRVTPTWQPTFSTAGSARYQQAIGQVGSKVWLGGSQHSMFSYNTSTFALENKHITKAGGDVQAITAGNGLVFAGCHCENWNYSDTAAYDSTSPGSTNVTWTQADKVYYVAAHDAVTGDLAQEWTPEMRARGGRGVWALQVADDGTLWAGGTLTSSVKENGQNGWVGGFVRYAPRPHTAPSGVSKVKAELDGTDAKLSFDSSANGSVTYEILRNDRVVAVTTSKEATVPGSSASDRFFVRVADAWGNRSASSASVTPTVKVATTTLMSAASTWRYYFSNAATVPNDWKSAIFDDASWKSGTAPLGFGAGPFTTDIDVPAGESRAVTSYYRNTFEVLPGSKFGTVTLTTRADDAIAVHVNGTEVGRANLPSGALTPTTYAQSSPRTATALASPTTFTIPVSALKIGVNQIAVEVHSMYKATPDSSMDASIVAEVGDSAPQPASTTTPLIKQGATWSYLFNNATTVPTDWTTSEAATANWLTGPAGFGWGTGPIATNIDVASGTTRALTSYYRKSFGVTGAAAVQQLTLVTRADDGIAVYVNGVEVGRANLPGGTLTPTTYATSAVSTSAAISNPVTFDVPPNLLREGANSIAVEVHSNYRSTPNTSMDLTLTAKS